MLTPEQHARFSADGFVLLAGRFTLSEVHQWIAECERLWRDAPGYLSADRSKYRRTAGGGRPPDRVDSVLDHSPLFAQLVADPRIVDPVSMLIGAPASLMHAKLITRRQGAMGYRVHQDYPSWEHLGVAADAMLSVQVSIDRATADNGAVELYPALHRARLPAPTGAPHGTGESALRGTPAQVIASEPGDLLCFHSLAPHQSASNRTAHPRRTLYLTYAGRFEPARSPRHLAARSGVH
jgi:ectoine hydroxylase-related dioxygenase (phytanoyl-CoA dioxygenase family)